MSGRGNLEENGTGRKVGGGEVEGREEEEEWRRVREVAERKGEKRGKDDMERRKKEKGWVEDLTICGE